MKLLDITQSYLSDSATDIGGIFIHRQFLALKSLGWDIQVINPQALLYRDLKRIGRYYPRTSARDGIPIWRPRFLWFPFFLVSAGIWLERLYAQSVFRIVGEITADWKPDLIVGDWLVPGGFAAARLAKQFQAPLVLRARGHDVPIIVKAAHTRARNRRHYQRILDAADLIICQGERLSEQLIQSNLSDPARIIYLTNGLDTDVFHPASPDERVRARETLNLPHEAQVWFYAGRWETAKGSRELEDALKNLLPLFPHVHFIAAGPIRDTQSYNTLRQFSNRVHFLGAQSPSNMGTLYRVSDVFVLPSHREGLPNAVLEAMACGLVVVTTPVGGLPSVIRDGVNGLFVGSQNASVLQQTLARCGENLSAYRPLGEAARQTIFDDGYDLESVSRSIHERFTSLVQLREGI